jgi:predicted  nucleic acid-binding Zn-ribbon protein
LRSEKPVITDSENSLSERQAYQMKEICNCMRSISDHTEEERDFLTRKRKRSDLIEERLLSAYERIRANARNGLAVVPVQRDACGGCFNQIPPQRQLDIKSRKKIIECEYCGRILVDDEIINETSI